MLQMQQEQQQQQLLAQQQAISDRAKQTALALANEQKRIQELAAQEQSRLIVKFV